MTTKNSKNSKNSSDDDDDDDDFHDYCRSIDESSDCFHEDE
jgi:hypothetical protein